MANFLSPLSLRYLDAWEVQDGKFWEVQAPFSYAVGAPDGTTVVHVPAGFRTDFASTPRILWSLIPPTGWYGKICVIHDQLYQCGKIGDMIIDQKYADDVLNEGMCVLAAAWILEHGRTQPGYPQHPHGELRTLMTREAVYCGVRIGGQFTWRRYRKQEKK